MLNKLKTGLEEILKPIDSYLNKVDQAIPEILNTNVPLMDESALHIFKKGGKKIRASILILCSGLMKNIPDDVIDLAAAVEIFHGATLIHDDIIDQAFLRRGDITVSSEWGAKVAVLAGDFMHVRALQTILSNSKSVLLNELLDAALDMFKGEIYQIEYSGVDVINQEHYFKIIELKTAILMGTCAKLGAMKSGMSEAENDNLYRFGLNLGRAFQIIDDTLDYAQENNTAGKDIGNDFRNGKVTLPLLHVLESATSEEKEMLISALNNPSDEAWKNVKLLIKKYDAIQYSRKTAEGFLEKAIPYLDIFPSSLNKEKLIELAGFLIYRNY